MDVSLAYRDDMFAEWTEMAHERVPRKLKCTFTSPKVGYLAEPVFCVHWPTFIKQLSYTSRAGWGKGKSLDSKNLSVSAPCLGIPYTAGIRSPGFGVR